MEQVNSLEQIEGISYEYRDDNHEHSHSYLKHSVDRLVANIPPGSTVLDLGCGNGSFISLYRDRGWKLYGTDFSASGIEIARRNYPDIDFSLGDAENSSGGIFERIGPVDLIISTEVIEHLYDPRGFVRNAYSLLKPNGVFIVTTPYHGYLKNVMLAVAGKLDDHFTALWDHGHIKFWSRKTLSHVLTEAGFSDLQMVGSGRLPYMWKSMVMRCKKSYPFVTRP